GGVGGVSRLVRPYDRLGGHRRHPPAAVGGLDTAGAVDRGAWQPPGRLPTKAELDAAAPRHPTYISFGAHVVIANTLALRERGITRDTLSPQGGTVVKDPLTGELTGELRERAQFLVKRRDGEIDPQILAERIAVELEQCSHRGATAIHDIIITKEEAQS